MNKNIIVRTLKTAFAALAAIILSNELSLEFASAAGIIAILNIFETRRATIKGGLKRSLSAVVALIIGGICFESFGYKTWVFGLYLLLFVPVSFLLEIELGLGPSSVIVTHLLAFGEINAGIIINEMALVVIGTGFAMLTNLYAPNSISKLKNLIKSIDDDMRFILNLFGHSLVKNLDVKEYEDKIKRLDENIDKAIEIAARENDNLIENSSEILHNIRLREREMDLLEEMYYDLLTIPPEYKEGKYVSDILIKTADSLSPQGDMASVRKEIKYLKDHFTMMKLPEDHEEFTVRSAVFQVFRSLDQFIEIRTYISNKRIK